MAPPSQVSITSVPGCGGAQSSVLSTHTVPSSCSAVAPPQWSQLPRDMSMPGEARNRERPRGYAPLVTTRTLAGKVIAVVGTGGLGRALVEFARQRFGRLDGVVLAAGVVAFGDLAEADDVVVEELLLTNAIGPLWLAKRVAPALRESRGFLVNISGMVAATPMPGMAAYSASKAAAAAGFAALRKEWRRAGVLVCDVQPPHTETGLATRPLAGTAPRLPQGLAPRAVAERIIAAIEADEPLVTAADFG